MANGDSAMKTMLLEMAIKQGTATVLAGLLLWAFWAVVIEPGAQERVRFTDTIIESSKMTAAATKETVSSMQSIAKSTEDIRDSVVAQKMMLDHINKELEQQTELRETAMETMSAFADRVRGDHPMIDEKLDTIIEQTKP